MQMLLPSTHSISRLAFVMIFKNDEWHQKSLTPTSNHFEFLERWDELWLKFQIQIVRMCFMFKVCQEGRVG
jgi:hypothetical protein